MLTEPARRVQVQSTAAKGEIMKLRVLINHQMETGLRHDKLGRTIPRDIINKFTCRYNGQAAFSVDMHEAVAENPYFEFFLRATESGRLEFLWEEDGGAVYKLESTLTVA
jgi:sulfur-oxidizing protein SoxZ